MDMIPPAELVEIGKAIIESGKPTEAEAFLSETCGANPSHAVLAEICASLRKQLDQNEKDLSDALRDRAELRKLIAELNGVTR